LKDHFEITGHDEAIKWIEEVVKEESPLTETFIRQLHTLILKEPYEVDAVTLDGKPTKRKIEVGKYKTTPNHVRTQTGETFYFATPEETPAKMHDLIEWFREKKSNPETNPVILAAEFQYKFILIHPFDDGNGRTARILMNFILMQHGYPPAIIKTGDKENYYRVLQQADAGILEPFIEYIAQNLVRSLEIMIKGAKGESIEEPDDLDKELALLERKLQTAGQEIKVSKSKETILELFDNSITPLVKEFVMMCEKFNRFYVESKFFLLLDNVVRENSKGDELSNTRSAIQEDSFPPSSILLIYNYTASSQSGLGNFSFEANIEIHFELTEYKTLCNHQTIYTKPYSELLSEEEIKQIVNYEAKRHKDFIENQIQSMSKEST
jgi:fido (protein-threonine AMPylation protein)